jgi:hypothetical protein
LRTLDSGNWCPGLQVAVCEQVSTLWIPSGPDGGKSQSPDAGTNQKDSFIAAIFDHGADQWFFATKSGLSVLSVVLSTDGNRWSLMFSLKTLALEERRILQTMAFLPQPLFGVIW